MDAEPKPAVRQSFKRAFLRTVLYPAMVGVTAHVGVTVAHASEEGEATAFACPGGPGPGETQVGMHKGHGLQVPLCVRSSSAPGKSASTAGPTDLWEDGWHFMQLDSKQHPGQACTAHFTHGAQHVAVSGPGPGVVGAMLSFWSPEIPRPESPSVLQVGLLQTGSTTPAQVQAISVDHPDMELGSIVFAVPTSDAMLDSMLDTQAFTVTLNDKTVAQITWTDGHIARDRLRACIQGAPI